MLISFRNWAICVQGCDPREKENKQSEPCDHLVFLPQAVSQFWKEEGPESGTVIIGLRSERLMF